MNRPVKPNVRLALIEDDTYIAPGLPAEQTILPKTAATFRKERESLFRASPSNFTDPLSVMLTVDAILRIRPDSRIRASELTNTLRDLYPQILWDPYTVGRILTNIAEAATGCGAPADQLPVASYRSGGLATYVVNATLKNWRWLALVRHNLGQLASTSLEEERRAGKPAKYAEFPWEPFTSAQWGQ